MLRFLYNMVLLSVMMVVSGEAKTMANTASLIFMSGNSQELGELLAWLSGVKYKNIKIDDVVLISFDHVDLFDSCCLHFLGGSHAWSLNLTTQKATMLVPDKV